MITNIEALRARMRELADEAMLAPHLGHHAEKLRDAAMDKFQALASPANVKALDAEITRLREDLDRVTRERDAQYDENVNRIAAEGAAILRAEATEAALAKRDEEVARMRETMRAASVYLRKLEDNMLANDADMMLDDCLPPSFHADQIDRALTQEPTNAE